MKGGNIYAIVILKSWYCLNVYERKKYIWYSILKSLHCLNVYERQKYIWYCNIKEFVLFKYISQGEIHMVL